MSRKTYDIVLTEENVQRLKSFGIDGDPSAFLSGMIVAYEMSVFETLDYLAELDKKIEKAEKRLKALEDERKAVYLVKEQKMRHLDDEVRK